jgi:hypothetical protein
MRSFEYSSTNFLRFSFADSKISRGQFIVGLKNIMKETKFNKQDLERISQITFGNRNHLTY